jgi:hypothetical protein
MELIEDPIVYKMNTLPAEMICEIVKHLDGRDMIRFMMSNKELYNMFKKERKKIYWKMYDEAKKHNKNLFDAYEYGVYEDYFDDMKFKCLMCFKYLSYAENCWLGIQYCDKCSEYINDIKGIHYLYPCIYTYVNKYDL